MPNTLWKDIKLYDAGGDVSKDWYISYYFYSIHTEKFERFKAIDDLNSYSTKTKRYARAKILVRGLERLLSSYNFNPEEEFPEGSLDGRPPAPEGEDGYTLEHCRHKYLAEVKVHLEPDTYRKYEQRLNDFCEWVGSRRLGFIRIHEVTKNHITEFLSEGQTGHGWSNKNRNHYLTDIRTFFNYFINNYDGYLARNPTAGIKKLKVNKKGNRPFAATEFKRILEYTAEHDRPLHLFLKFCYYACCRPDAEAINMQRRHFNLENRTMRVDGEISKNDHTQYVPIDDAFYSFLVDELCISDLPSDYYLWGKGYEPGPKPIYKKAYSRRFRKVKQALNLHPDNTLYCCKHTRACNLVEDGTSLYRVQEITRHLTLAALMDYLKDMGVTVEKRAPIISRRL